ncbi:MAG: hypothetical protein N2596_00105, partial [Syntrophorhabdaceae bacterium]|nr:hypothetical protein [Syntrophorhabdaceae bacterium]
MKRYTLSSRIKGTICAPSSKSIMIRAVALALLAEGISIIKNPSECDDAKAALDIAEIFGAGIEKKDGLLFIEGNTSLKEKPIKKSHLHCGESGLCMRMFSPVAGLLDKEIVLEGQGTLLFRPMTMVEELVKLGARCSTKDGLPPVVVRGPISSGRYTLDGSLSSQFITG